MTTSTAGPPVRRSPLEVTHRRLTSARDDDAQLRWPMSYGDPDGERQAVAETIGLAEPGLYDKWVARGPDALDACRSLGLDARPGRVLSAAPGGINAWAIADDEVWLVTDAPIPGGPPLPSGDLASAVAHLRAARVFVTDVSSGWTVLRLAGPRVRDLLQEMESQDLEPDAIPDEAIIAVPMGGCRVILSRRDHGGIPGFTLLVARDEAQHLWDVLTEIGAPHGLRHVGASALLGASPTSTGATAAGGAGGPR